MMCYHGTMSIDTKALYKAIDAGRRDELSSLLDDLDAALSQQQKDDLLVYCLDQRRPFAAQELMFAGANPNITQGDEAVPLLSGMIARAQFEEAVMLTVMGADVNALDAEGNSPAHFAAGLNVPASAILEFLKNKGADLERKNKHGKTPMDALKYTDNKTAIRDVQPPDAASPGSSAPRTSVSM